MYCISRRRELDRCIHPPQLPTTRNEAKRQPALPSALPNEKAFWVVPWLVDSSQSSWKRGNARRVRLLLLHIDNGREVERIRACSCAGRRLRKPEIGLYGAGGFRMPWQLSG